MKALQTARRVKQRRKGEREKRERSPASEKPNEVAEEGNEELKEEVAETGGRSYEDQRPGAKADAKETQVTKPGGNGRIIVSPIAARMAAENGVDLKSLNGSGPDGASSNATSKLQLRSAAVSLQRSSRSRYFRPVNGVGACAYRDENASKMRQVIAQRLTESIGPIPTFYLTVEIEMDNALALRKQINSAVGDDDKISVNDIIVKVAAMSLMKHPFVNASYQDKTIRFYEQADIGVAVAVEEGLITPVVRGANLKGFGEISKEVKELAGRARERKLLPEEYTGATFSISNLGMFGIKEFTAIINPPEAAIIAVGGATPSAVVRERRNRRPQYDVGNNELRPPRR